MKINFRRIKRKILKNILKTPVIVAVISVVVTASAIFLVLNIKDKREVNKADVSLTDTYLRDANASYNNINRKNEVAGDTGLATKPSVTENTGNPATDNTNKDSSKDAANSNEPANTNTNQDSYTPNIDDKHVTNNNWNYDDNSGDDNSDEPVNNNYTYVEPGFAGVNDDIPSVSDGTNAGIASSNEAAGYAVSAGFKQLYSNELPVNDIYYYEENGIYEGQVVTYNNYTIIYIISRSPSFDAGVNSILTSLLGNYGSYVWQRFITANVSQSFYVGEDNRLVRIVVPNVDGHYQIVIYN